MEVNDSESNITNSRNDIQLPPLIDLPLYEEFRVGLIFQAHNDIDNDSSSMSNNDIVEEIDQLLTNFPTKNVSGASATNDTLNESHLIDDNKSVNNKSVHSQDHKRQRK